MKVEFKILHKDGKGIGVELPDGTIILVDKEYNGLRMAFPKKKFEMLFKKQREWKYYEVLFTEEEIKMWLKALDFKTQKSTTPKKAGHNYRKKQGSQLNSKK